MGNDQSKDEKMYRLQNEVNRKEQELQRQREKYIDMKRKRDAIQRERNTSLVGIVILSAVLCAVLFGTSGGSLVMSWTKDKLYTDATGFSATIIAIAIAYIAVFAVKYGGQITLNTSADPLTSEVPK